MSNKLGVNRTVVYRLLATLEQHALVRRDLGGRARVGLGVLRLGRQVHPLVREGAGAREAGEHDANLSARPGAGPPRPAALPRRRP
ncbi:helix-turn-helix domain-containing protein [Streptomyces sp. t39]|uniref:helix-turn-helix domain-containing protein n=1 Tax=Streptomyces sp. t39 TaxID=1828156 RepID=UPI0016501574